MRPFLLSFAAVLFLAVPAAAQDAVKADPAHHKVEFENDQVRVLRVTIAPGEKTPAHDHPAGVAVFLTDYNSRVTPVGGAVQERARKAGETMALAATKHVVENIGTTKAELIVVELKGTPAAAK